MPIYQTSNSSKLYHLLFYCSDALQVKGILGYNWGVDSENGINLALPAQVLESNISTLDGDVPMTG